MATDCREIVIAGINSTSGASDTDKIVVTDADGLIDPSFLTERVEDIVGALVTTSTSITWTYDDGAGTLTGVITDRDYGDITVTATGATWTIDNNAVSNAKLRDSAALSVIGRSANSTGDPADIAASADGNVLRRSGTTLGFGTVATAGLADNSVTFAKMQDIATDRLIGRDAAGSGDPTEISLNATLAWTGSNSFGINLANANSWTGAQTFSSVDINGGTVDNASIGATTPSTGAFTTLTASGNVNFDSGTLFVDAANNRVGVGTMSPERLFTVAGSVDGAEILFQLQNQAGRVLNVRSTNAVNGVWTFYTPDSYRFNIDSTVALRIDIEGRVGVLNDSPAEALDVAGNIAADTAFLVNNVHALTDVTTAGQTRTLDLSNGAVQTISANQAFTINVTGPTSKHGLIYFYIYNPSGEYFNVTAGTGWLTLGFFIVPASNTLLALCVWDGAGAWDMMTKNDFGDSRPT